MSKTPEELAEEWASKRTYIITINDTTTTIAKEAFLAGFKVGYNEAKKYWANQPKYDVGTEEE